MRIEINYKTTLRNLQESFSNNFPFLKIEFYNKVKRKYEASIRENLLYPGTPICELKKGNLPEQIEIQPWYKVEDLEKEFRKQLSLPVKLLWKVNNQWERAVGMEIITLEELNGLAQNSSTPLTSDSPANGFEKIT
jgi:hypothetical protein